MGCQGRFVMHISCSIYRCIPAARLCCLRILNRVLLVLAFASPGIYRDSDDCALLAVCSCHCSRTMVEADFMQLSPPQLVASWHEHAGIVQPRSWL